MAKTFTVEFTDEQWALILQWYPKQIGNYVVEDAWTEADMAACFQQRISREVLRQQASHGTALTDKFDEIIG